MRFRLGFSILCFQGQAFAGFASRLLAGVICAAVFYWHGRVNVRVLGDLGSVSIFPRVGGSFLSGVLQFVFQGRVHPNGARRLQGVGVVGFERAIFFRAVVLLWTGRTVFVARITGVWGSLGFVVAGL